MGAITLEHRFVDGIPFVRFEGDFTVSAFTALHLVVAGASRLGTLPVITDLSGDVTIAEEVRELKCQGMREDIPNWTTELRLFIVGPPERIQEIKALLLPHQLQPAVSVQEALDSLTEKRSASD